MMFKRLLFFLSVVVALAGSVFFGLLWCNNLVSAWRYHAMLIAGGDNVVADAQSPGFLPFLNWSVVDVTTVTTLIPFFGFVLIARGLLRIRHDEEWPFFDGYGRFNIALGLLGTIWGIILVGYYPPEQISIAALMRCLHTAMFSTLAAVAWVMVALPVVIQPWLGAVRKAKCGCLTEAGSLTEIADEFVSGVNAAGDALRRGVEDMDNFRRGLAETNASLARLLDSVAAGRAAEEAWRRSAAEGIAAFAAVAGELQSRQELLTAENRRLTERGRELEGSLEEAKQQLEKLQRQIAAIEDILK